MIGSKPYAELKCREIKGTPMAYIDEGEGDAVVFQHGQPTSSYVWRNVMPHLEGMGRLIACDLVGMGGSDKLDASLGPHRYSLGSHPRNVAEVVSRNVSWLAQSNVPKLFINGDPGTLVRGRLREIIRQWPNQTEVTVKGRKLLQEDSPYEIGAAIADFAERVKGSKNRS